MDIIKRSLWIDDDVYIYSPFKVKTNPTIFTIPKCIVDCLKCPICLDVLSNPVITKVIYLLFLQCMHRFCYDCLQAAMEKGKMSCPSCRRRIRTKRELGKDDSYSSLIRVLYPSERIERTRPRREAAQNKFYFEFPSDSWSDYENETQIKKKAPKKRKQPGYEEMSEKKSKLNNYLNDDGKLTCTIYMQLKVEGVESKPVTNNNEIANHQVPKVPLIEDTDQIESTPQTVSREKQPNASPLIPFIYHPPVISTASKIEPNLQAKKS